MSDLSQSLVSPSDIVRLVNDTAKSDRDRISASAVSNWRKRSADFPQPAGGTDARPLFALNAVLAWLEANGRRVRSDELTPEASVWMAASAIRDSFDVSQLGPLILLLACASKVSREEGVAFEAAFASLEHHGLADSNDRNLLRSVGSDRVGAISTALAAVPVPELVAVTEALFERSTAVGGKYTGESGLVGSPVSRMLADLVERERQRRGVVLVYDPACGIGETLFQASATAGSGSAFIGQDSNFATAMVARRRAFLRSRRTGADGTFFLAAATGGDSALVRIHTSNEFLLSPSDYLFDAKFDVVVIEPPFSLRVDDATAAHMLADPRYEFGRPPKSSADTAWLELCIAHLAEGGVGYVITAPGPLWRGGGERDIRRELLLRNCVRAIVQLPAKLYKQTAIPVVLWVLQRPETNAGQVLMVDASNEAATGVTHAIPEWVDGTSLLAVPHRLVDATDLAAGDANLTPALWVAPEQADPEEVQRRFATARTAARKHDDMLARWVDHLPQTLALPAPRVLSVEELKKERVLEWAVGGSRIGSDSTTADGDRPFVVRASEHVHRGWLPEPPGFNDEYDPADLITEAGDVLVATWSRISAIVDVTGGLVAGPGVYRLRVREDHVLLPDYLASILGGSWNAKFIGGTTMQRANIKDLEVPLLPLDAQRQVTEVLEQIRLARKAGDVVRTALTNYEDSLRDAIRFDVDLGGDE